MLEVPPDAPTAPDAADREWLLDALAELVAQRGASALLAPPLEPGPELFPERWRPTRAGVTVVARRAADHAGIEGVAIDVVDARPAPIVEPKEGTDLEVEAVAPDRAVLVLHLLGGDDVAGTSCVAVGTIIAAIARLGAEGPFRRADHAGVDDDTRRRGGVAAVWAGLGALAANAAYQQYTHGTPINGYAPVDYRVIRAGAVPMSGLAFLLAVQAEVRAADLPDGLKGPQRDEARAWRRALAGTRDALRARLGIAPDARGPDRRPPPGEIEDEIEDEPEDGEVPDAALGGQRVYRVLGHGGAIGTMLGMVAGGLSIGIATTSPFGAMAGVVAGAVTGYVVGIRRTHERCADCDVALPAGATRCPRCNGVLGRRIRHRNDRLDEAEKDAGAAA